MDSYQHGAPHVLNPKTKPKAIEFDKMPEVSVNKPPPKQLPVGEPDDLRSFIERLMYEASKLA